MEMVIGRDEQLPARVAADNRQERSAGSGLVAGIAADRVGTMRRHCLAIIAMLAALPSLGAVTNFKVTTDHSVDASSLESVVRDVIARSGAKTNDAKAVAIYEWLHHAIFHWAYATEPEPQSVGPLKLLHVYGWGLCGGQHTVLKALFETAGWECRYVGWSNPGHTTIEVKYDGRWHYFDVFLKCYFWSKDRSHIVSQEEIAADPSLVLDALKDGRAAREHLCCGDSAEGVISGVKSRKVAGDSKGWASVTWRDENWSPKLSVPCGASLRLEWKSADKGFAVSGRAPQHSCGTFARTPCSARCWSTTGRATGQTAACFTRPSFRAPPTSQMSRSRMRAPTAAGSLPAGAPPRFSASPSRTRT
jgi:Transglutaminase-like superfamily